MWLDNKVALISGGARGMGAVTARLFASENAKVVIGDVLEEEGRQTEAQINEAGGECLFVRLDVTSESNWQDVVAATVARFGKLDILVNNAGISGQGLGLEATSADQWDRVMDINAKGVFLGIKAAIPQMRKAGGGSIIYLRSGRQRRAGCLSCVQRRGAVIDQGHRHPIRGRRDQGEFSAPRLHRHSNDRSGRR